MEPLVSLPIERWPELRDSYKKRGPLGVIGVNLLDTQIKFQQLGLGCHFELYCPYGDIANGIVAIITKAQLTELIVIAGSVDTSKLEETLVKTRLMGLIHGQIQIQLILDHTRKCLERIYLKLGLEIVDGGPEYIYRYSRDAKPFQIVVCPRGTYVAPLQPHHAEHIDTRWRYRYPSSDWFFRFLIKANQSYGLFSSEDSTLVAWMLINELGLHCHLYCEEMYRRNGYAEFIVKYVTNDLISAGKDPCTLIVDGNDSSNALFQKLGYEYIGTSFWHLVGKK